MLKNWVTWWNCRNCLKDGIIKNTFSVQFWNRYMILTLFFFQSLVFSFPVFHPLVDSTTGELDVKRAFPKWRYCFVPTTPQDNTKCLSPSIHASVTLTIYNGNLPSFMGLFGTVCSWEYSSTMYDLRLFMGAVRHTAFSCFETLRIVQHLVNSGWILLKFSGILMHGIKLIMLHHNFDLTHLKLSLSKKEYWNSGHFDYQRFCEFVSWEVMALCSHEYCHFRYLKWPYFVVPNLPSQFSFQKKYQPHMAGIAVCSSCFLQNWHQITLEQGSCCIVCIKYYFGL